MREQISDIISYVRANVKVKELLINISRNSSAKLGLQGVMDGVELEGGAHVEFGNDYSAKIKCDKPLKPSEKKTVYSWIDDFPHVVSIIDNAEAGTFEIKEIFDLSFGLSIKAAKSIGANLDWNAKHSFEFTVIAG